MTSSGVKSSRRAKEQAAAAAAAADAEAERADRVAAQKARRSKNEKLRRQAMRAAQTTELSALDAETLGALGVFEAVPALAADAVTHALSDVWKRHARHLQAAGLTAADVLDLARETGDSLRADMQGHQRALRRTLPRAPTGAHDRRLTHEARVEAAARRRHAAVAAMRNAVEAATAGSLAAVQDVVDALELDALLPPAKQGRRAAAVVDPAAVAARMRHMTAEVMRKHASAHLPGTPTSGSKGSSVPGETDTTE
jgi:hypothetical protein